MICSLPGLQEKGREIPLLVDRLSFGRRVEVGLKRVSGDFIELSVRDSGVGLPPGYDVSRSPSLGHTLMNLLAKQVGGTVEVFSDEGTVVRLRF